MRVIRDENWLYFLVFIVYLFISFLLSLLTTRGWSGFLTLIYLGGGIVLLSLGMLTITIIRSAKKIHFLNLNLLGLIPLLIVQIATLLFNPQDCGDVQGSFSFLRYALNNFSIDNLCGYQNYATYSPIIWFLFLGVYFLFIIIYFFIMIKPGRPKEKIKTPLWLKITIWIAGLSFIISSLKKVFF